MNYHESMSLAPEPLAAQRQLSSSVHSKITGMALCLCFGLLGAGCGPSLATKAENVVPTPTQKLKENHSEGAEVPFVTEPEKAVQTRNPMLDENYSEDAEVPVVVEPKTAAVDGSTQVNFGSESASRRTRDMADWVVSSKDNHGKPFAIVDKINAKVYVFSVDGMLYGAAPVLLGLGIGDDVAPGVGNMRMGLIPPAQRTTPAGRFEATMGRNSHGKEILWVDYDNSISMHPVVTNNPKERRQERLDTPTVLDNRISYGCINVPVAFFKDVIHSKFSGTNAVVYVLPETKRHRSSQSRISDQHAGIGD